MQTNSNALEHTLTEKFFNVSKGSVHRGLDRQEKGITRSSIEHKKVSTNGWVYMPRRLDDEARINHSH